MGTSLPFSRSLLYPLTAVLVALAVVPVASVGYRFVTTTREQVETLEKLNVNRQAVVLARELHLTFRDSLARVLASVSFEDVTKASERPDMRLI